METKYILNEVNLFFEPLALNSQEPELIFSFLSDLGWYLDDTSNQKVISLTAKILAALLSLKRVEQLSKSKQKDVNYVSLVIQELQPTLSVLKEFSSDLSNIDTPELTELPTDILLHLTSQYLFYKNPKIYYTLELLTILHPRENELIQRNNRLLRAQAGIPFLDFKRIFDLLKDPSKVLGSTYWPQGLKDLSTTNEVVKKLAHNLQGFLSVFEVYTFYGGGEGPEELSPEEELRLDSFLTLFKHIFVPESDEIITIGSTVGLLPKNDEGGPGVILLPFGQTELFTVIGEWGFGLRLDALADGIQITKDGFDFVGTDSSGNVGARLQAQKLSSSELPAFRFGSLQGTYFSIGAFGFDLGFKLFEQRQEFSAMITLNDLKLKVQAGEEDAFLKSVLPSEGLKAEASTEFGYSNLSGFHFKGSGGLEILLPHHVNLGPVELQSLLITLKLRKSGSLPLKLGANVAAKLGPLQVVVQNVGLNFSLDFPEANDGNLLVADLDFGFKPPNGVGLSINTETIKGGGYLSFNDQKGEYAGAIELVFSEFLTLKAIGIITTKMPDGSDGFSLLIIIAAEFGAGIQLGFGFTLLGVGGLLGLNRTMLLGHLADRVRTGAANNILFPRDVVKNISRIISDLQSVFPPEQNKFLIGPMAKLGWGTPTIFSLSLGLIIEIPGNIAILGVLRIALPADTSGPGVPPPLVIFQVSFIGAVDFTKKQLFFFATLFESRVLHMTISGEIGVLTAFGNNPTFLVSIGGFHPQFTPPPMPFAVPKRLTIDLLNQPKAKIRVMGYFAVTSNTVQFGARADLKVDIVVAQITGHLAFDALIQFSPFYFIVSISASLSVSCFLGEISARVRLSLEGPTKWRARGRGEVKIIWFEIAAEFDISWGETRNTTLPKINAMPILKAELGKLQNWQAKLPSATNRLLVSLRNLEEEEGLILHPVGALRVSQKSIPLDLTIDKVGNQKVRDFKSFKVTVQESDLEKVQDVWESFAPAQFQDMEDTRKLSRPGYEPQHGGLDISVKDHQLRSGPAVKRSVGYEEVTIDTEYRRQEERRQAEEAARMSGLLFDHFQLGGSIAQSPLSHRSLRHTQPFEEKIEIQREAYAVVSVKTNRPIHPDVTFESEAMARDYMNDWRSKRENQSLIQEHTDIHVIPICEAVTA